MDMGPFLLNFSLLFLFSTFVLSSPIPTVKTVAASVLGARGGGHTGRGTWYEPGLGNCGWNNSRDQNILAIGKSLYDRNGGSNCGQWVEIYNTQNGNRASGYVVDSCQSCSDNDIDMSPALFQQLDSPDRGVIQVTWDFLPK